MAILYKHFAPLRTVLYTILFGLLFLPVHAYANESLFTIQGVEVDVTAEDAATARKQAFMEAQLRAFKELSHRMVAEGEGSLLLEPAPAAISTLIQDFEITKEKLSNVRYIGMYTFRFNKKAVQTFFRSQGLGYTDVSSRPVMVLPYYQGETRPVLWEGDNPFNEAWSRTTNLGGIVPISVPLGDVSDLRDLGQGDVLSYDPEGIQAMLSRYNAGEAVILLAIPDSQLAMLDSPDGIVQGGLSVHLYRTDQGAPEHVGRVDIEAGGGETRTMFYNRAVKQVQQAIQQNWKKRTVVSASQGNRLQVKVRFANLQQWAETQSVLSSVQGINSVNLVRLGRDHALVDLIFQGSEKRLRLALAQADMILTKPRIGVNLAGGPSAGSALLYELYLKRYRPSPETQTHSTPPVSQTSPVQEEEETNRAPVIQRDPDEGITENKNNGWRGWF